MAENWIKKYEPAQLGEIEAQKSAIKELDSFISDFKKQKKKAALIYGPTGCGKTITVYALAKKHNYEILEVNASEFRNKEQIELKVGAAVKQQSLFSKGKIILVDEVDGLSGKEDRGGVSAIAGLISESSFPIIMTANNPWDSKFSALRSKAKLVGFEALDHNSVHNVMKKICINENIKYDDIVLKSLARRIGGDLRAGINDLQTLTQTKKELTKESLEDLAERSRIESMPSALVKVLKTTDPEIAIAAFNNVEEDMDKWFLWIDENLPKEYTNPDDLARAYEMMSRADVFKGRIRRWQHWRFLVYINILLTAGIAVSKQEKYKHFVKYSPTTRILKLYKAKMRYQKRKAIAQKMAEHTHTSTKQIIKNTMPFMQIIFKNNEKMGDAIAEELDLEKEEVEWLRK